MPANTAKSEQMKPDREQEEEQRLYLHITLDEVKRSNGHVSEATAEDTAGGACCVEGRRVHLDLAGLAGSWNHEPAAAARSGGGRRGRGGGRGGENLLEG